MTAIVSSWDTALRSTLEHIIIFRQHGEHGETTGRLDDWQTTLTLFSCNFPTPRLSRSKASCSFHACNSLIPAWQILEGIILVSVSICNRRLSKLLTASETNPAVFSLFLRSLSRPGPCRYAQHARTAIRAETGLLRLSCCCFQQILPAMHVRLCGW
jgi:hypothetical protein